jgi:Regulator of G protein signaling domain
MAASPARRRLKALNLTLEDVLDDEELLPMLTAFAKKSWALENVEFVVRVKKWRTLRGAEERKREGTAIAEKYLRKGGEQEVNVDDSDRQLVWDCLSNFDELDDEKMRKSKTKKKREKKRSDSASSSSDESDESASDSEENEDKDKDDVFARCYRRVLSTLRHDTMRKLVASGQLHTWLAQNRPDEYPELVDVMQNEDRLSLRASASPNRNHRSDYASSLANGGSSLMTPGRTKKKSWLDGWIHRRPKVQELPESIVPAASELRTSAAELRVPASAGGAAAGSAVDDDSDHDDNERDDGDGGDKKKRKRRRGDKAKRRRKDAAEHDDDDNDEDEDDGDDDDDDDENSDDNEGHHSDDKSAGDGKDGNSVSSPRRRTSQQRRKKSSSSSSRRNRTPRVVDDGDDETNDGDSVAGGAISPRRRSHKKKRLPTSKSEASGTYQRHKRARDRANLYNSRSADERRAESAVELAPRSRSERRDRQRRSASRDRKSTLAPSDEAQRRRRRNTLQSSDTTPMRIKSKQRDGGDDGGGDNPFPGIPLKVPDQ